MFLRTAQNCWESGFDVKPRFWKLLSFEVFKKYYFFFLIFFSFCPPTATDPPPEISGHIRPSFSWHIRQTPEF